MSSNPSVENVRAAEQPDQGDSGHHATNDRRPMREMSKDEVISSISKAIDQLQKFLDSLGRSLIDEALSDETLFPLHYDRLIWNIVICTTSADLGQNRSSPGNDSLQKKGIIFQEFIVASLKIAIWAIARNVHILTIKGMLDEKLPPAIVTQMEYQIRHLIALERTGNISKADLDVSSTKLHFGRILSWYRVEEDPAMPETALPETALPETALPETALLSLNILPEDFNIHIRNMIKSGCVSFSFVTEKHLNFVYLKRKDQQLPIVRRFLNLANNLTLCQDLHKIEYCDGGATIKSRKWWTVMAWTYTVLAVTLGICVGVFNWGKRSNQFERIFDCIQTQSFLLISLFGLVKLTSEDDNAIRNTLLGKRVVRDADAVVRSLCKESQSMLAAEITVGGIKSPWLDAQYSRVLDSNLCTGDLRINRRTLVEDLVYCGAVLVGKLILLPKKSKKKDPLGGIIQKSRYEQGKTRCIVVDRENIKMERIDTLAGYSISGFIPIEI